MSLLEMKSVGKGFGGRKVLDGVNLSLKEGDFAAIVGMSGSGKTTLVSLIAGLIAPDQGEILLDGKPVRGPGPDRGVIFQNYSLLPWMTVYENVHLAVDAVSPSLSAAEKKDRTDHFIRMVKLDKASHKRPKELSGGMRQRVCVARGLAMDPRILLLDEPFSALDALTRATLQDELARIWEGQKKTVVMITNDVDEAVLLADRIYPLTPGPGAHLGDPITVDIPRPRERKRLSLLPSYQKVRREIVDFMLHHRSNPGAGMPPPPTPTTSLRFAAQGAS
jgi:nitrate/nitrite transport system ATP-binding protein